MTGAVLQLKLKGSQDKYLTDNPEISFFKKEYKRHVNFAIEQVKVYFMEQVDFGKKISVTLPKRADLLSNMSLFIKFPKIEKTSGNYSGWTNSVGHAIIETIELEIGNRLIDKHYGVFLELWDELTSNDKNENIATGKVSNNVILRTNALYENLYVVPMKFWFCNSLSTALPLLKLFYQEVKLKIKLRPFSECIVYDGETPPKKVSILDSYLIVNYIYLDDSYRMMYKQEERIELLITQLQYKEVQGSDTNTQGGVFKTDLPFNHPVKEIIWYFTEEESINNNDWFNFSQRFVIDRVFPLMKSAEFLIDGRQREDLKDELVYRIGNSDRFHTNTIDKHFYCMPFCDDPENWEPTGSLNFSKIDSAVLQGEMNQPISENRMYIFAINYNWLIIENGQCGLMFIT